MVHCLATVGRAREAQEVEETEVAHWALARRMEEASTDRALVGTAVGALAASVGVQAKHSRCSPSRPP